jgi:hypothetical protein
MHLCTVSSIWLNAAAAAGAWKVLVSEGSDVSIDDIR